MKEKLRKKKLILRLLGVAIVLLAVATVFIPIFKTTKTVETLGVKETITAEFSIWQVIIQDKEIELNSTSALGEFKGFSTVKMADLLGGEEIAILITGGLIIFSAGIVIYGIGVLLASLIDSLQRGTLKHFMLSFLFLIAFSYFVLSVTLESVGYSFTPPIVFTIILAVVLFAVMEIFDKIFSDITALSAEIFLRKYKNENKKWFEAFTKDIIEYMNNSNILVEIDTIVRFIDVVDRKEMREQEEKEKQNEQGINVENE